MSAEISGFRRFLHWGPITALGIIKVITFTTLYMNSMWWPPNRTLGGFINQALFLSLSTAATFNYVMATLTGPGLLPLKWKPKNLEDIENLQYCKVCEGYKAPRSHHCRKCDRCVKKMDHHCPWINHCVGWANHAFFSYFLGFAIIGSFHATIILICAFYRGIHRYWYLTHGQSHLATVHFTMGSIIWCIFAMGLAIGVVIALGMLLYFQLKSIIRNQTSIEQWITEKALYRRYNQDDDFTYPYDLGTWLNLRQVFDSTLLQKGEGIDWPVLDSCDQFTLTREQIAQKMEKRARTKTFKCLRPATGRFLPLFSQGFRVCLSPPCTDEPRISLCPDDIIKVTRFRKHWLFGEIVLIDRGVEDVKKHRKGPIRGWFPRRCAVELIELEDCVCTTESDEAGGDNTMKLNESRSQHAPNGVSSNSNKSQSNDNSPTNVKQQNGGHRKKNN